MALGVLLMAAMSRVEDGLRARRGSDSAVLVVAVLSRLLVVFVVVLDAADIPVASDSSALVNQNISLSNRMWLRSLLLSVGQSAPKPNRTLTGRHGRFHMMPDSAPGT